MEEPFGQLIEPFGQYPEPRPPHKKLQSWHSIREDFVREIHNGKDDGAPEYPGELQVLPDGLIAEIEEHGKIISPFETKKTYCYLWVINENKIIEILWESTPNEKHIPDKLVKHSNITSGGLAFNGGEIYFASNNRIFINNASDRYGLREKYWKGVLEVFKKIYYKYSIVDIQKW